MRSHSSTEYAWLFGSDLPLISSREEKNGRSAHWADELDGKAAYQRLPAGVAPHLADILTISDNVTTVPRHGFWQH